MKHVGELDVMREITPYGVSTEMYVQREKCPDMAVMRVDLPMASAFGCIECPRQSLLHQNV